MIAGLSLLIDKENREEEDEREAGGVRASEGTRDRERAEKFCASSCWPGAAGFYGWL
jgi:hypothetical protein